MSAETSAWLNNNTLIGYTDKRGNAWHYRESEQGSESNHYAGAVPEADVLRRLFHWTPVEGDISVTALTPSGVLTVPDNSRKAILRPDTGDILGIFRPGYQIHNYRDWLLNNVKAILDSPDLGIGSAGLLRRGGVAWVQVEMSETITTPEGVEHRPFLTAATSLDGTLASTYQTGSTAVVCDNTLSAALSDKTHQIKIKHSAKSLQRIGEVRQALDVIHSVADSFNAEVAALCAETVSDKEWSAFLSAHLSEPGDGATKNARTIFERKREELTGLWKGDPRVSPWKGTAWGVVQAVNTHAHHVATVKGMGRAERNMVRMVTGEWDTLDASTLATLRKVQAAV